MKKKILPILFVTCAVLPLHGALVITEIGADTPTNTDATDEYVVIHNTGPGTVDLTGFSIDDNAGTSGDLIPGATMLNSGGYLVLSAGSAQPALEAAWSQTIPVGTQFVVVSGLDSYNNGSADGAVLRDSVGGSTVATLNYSPSAVEGFAMVGGTATAIPFSTITAAAVPEPSSTALLGLGGVALILRRRK
jgi:hypothetical protein